jgi:tetratricopeptide (TPR) repeat protein
VREGARALVIPTVAEVGGHVRMTAEIVDPNTQTTVYSDSVDAQGDEGLLPGMDDLLRKMRGRLGESLASVSEASRPLAQITTRNIDALRALGKAEEEHGRGKINEALVLLKEALRLDPKFALAWVRLSTLQNAYLGDSRGAYESLQQALVNRDRLSAREQLFLDGTISQYEDANRWIEKWTAAVQLYPDAVAAQQNLGIGYLWYQHRLEEATPHFAAIANSRHPLRAASWIALAVIETERGDDRKAMEYVGNARRLATIMPHFEDVVTDLAARRYEAVTARLLAIPATLPDTLQAEKQLKLAAVAIDKEDEAGAAAALESATQYSSKTPSRSQQSRIRLAVAAFQAATRSDDAQNTIATLIDDEMSRATTKSPTNDGSAAIHLAIAAMLAARTGGDVSKARAGLDASKTMALDHGYYDRGALWRTADCEVRFAAKPDARVACLVSLVDGREYYQTHVALQRAYHAANETAKAGEQQQWLQAHRGQAVAELENEVALIPNLLDARRTPDIHAKGSRSAVTSSPSR